MTATNIALIGMPGAGKSTIGVVLAKALGYTFVDTDLLLQARTGKRLAELIAQQGLQALLGAEEDTLLGLTGQHTVYATGGSAVYSARGMTHLRELAHVIWLDVPLDSLRQRVRNMNSRGVVIGPGQSLEHLYAERRPLYQRYAHCHLDCQGLDLEQIVASIQQRIS